MSTLVTNPRSRPHADTRSAASWREAARCAGRHVLFASSDDIARAMCAACPVMLQCLDEALHEEGNAAPSYRADIRGGLDPLQRATLAGYRRRTAGRGRIAGDMDEAERLLRLGTMSDQKISSTTGVGRDSVGKLRRTLGLPPVADPNAASPRQRLAQRTRPGPGGHVLWVGSEITVVSGRNVKGIRLAFEVGYGRLPDGVVKRTCDVEGCVAPGHLTDRAMRRTARGTR